MHAFGKNETRILNFKPLSKNESQTTTEPFGRDVLKSHK